MTHDGRQNDAAAWSGYWHATARGSIPMDHPGVDPLALALRTHWMQQVPWISQSSAVLDVGSGSAVLARTLIDATPPETLARTQWWCMDEASGLNTHIDATAYPNIHWLAPTDFATSSPGSDQRCAEAIVSNFGMEYAARDAALQACSRWIAPAGTLHWVMHARDSWIDRQTLAGLDHLEAMLVEHDIITKAHKVLDALTRLPADPSARARHALAERENYNDAVNAVTARARAKPLGAEASIDCLRAITHSIQLARQGSASDARNGLDQVANTYRQEVRRLRSMHRASLSASDLDMVGHKLTELGFVPSMTELDVEGTRLAWVVHARHTVSKVP